MRVFVADDGGVRELTGGDEPVVRVAAPDLQQARRVRARIRADSGDVAVILDLAVAVGVDFRSAQQILGPADAGTVRYVGTVAGLAGLISDIASAEVADGVTLIPAAPRQDLATVGRDVLARLADARQIDRPGIDHPRAS
ncbi:hypothetical protein ACNUDN_24650 [Mycobacterium sp. smrl_JER01]|uniref:hypothetical protein n=1 Tax=Mycobacterium sp. smrl_JER01 TaxID=3402633 RepID=UPI003ACAD05D